MVLNPKNGKLHGTILHDELQLEIEKREESIAANLDNLEFIRMWLVVTQRKEKQDTHDAHGTV